MRRITRFLASSTLWALLIAPSGLAAADEASAIAAIEQAGGSVRDIAINSDAKEVAYHLAAVDVTDEQLAPLAEIPELIWVNLRGTKISDAGLAHLTNCGALTKLHLEKTAITDEGLAHLAGLTNLEYLNLYGTQVSDAGLAHLEGLTNLKKLYLWQTQVTPEAAAALREKLPELEIVMGLSVEPPPADDGQ